MAKRATPIHGQDGRNQSGRLVPRFIVPARDVQDGLFAANDNQEPLSRRLRRLSRVTLCACVVIGLIALLIR